MSIKLAVFDIAGTTVADKNFVGKAFQKAFYDFGFEIGEEDANTLMGYKKTLAIERMLQRLDAEFDAALIDDIHESFTAEMLDFYTYDPQVKPLPAAEEVFLWCKENGIRVALNTGFPKVIADAIISRLQWKDKNLVDDYIASDEVSEGRPRPFMIEQLMFRADVDDPMLVAKTGDTEVDIEEGKAAGCGLVVAVTTGACQRSELEEYQPNYIIDSLSEFPSLVKI
jgi:phosphonatase-like hydrolase